MKIKKLNESKLSFKMYDGRKRINKSYDTAKNYKGKILEESLGSDYSHIEEVKSIDYSNDKNNNLPGISNIKKFKNALDNIDKDAFKIRTSRLKNISHADLKDEFGGNAMKPWKFFKDWDNSVKGFNEFYFFYKTGKLPKKSVNEAFDVDKVQKRIARVNEFDNGHVMHNDWTRMSSQEAEEKAKQMSIKNPDEVYYVKYDSVMEPCSDIKWKNGKQLTEDVPMEYTDTSNFKNLQDESDEYQAELKRKSRNRQLLHKIFDKYGLIDSDDYWADKVYWMFANAQEIKVVDDASKVPHKTNDGQKIKYIISTPNTEVDVHADAFGDYIWVVTKDSLEESISFDNNEFFTREEINEAAEKVVEHINETFNEKYILAGTWLEKGIWIVNVQTEDRMYEFETNCQIDMRKVKKPSDIEKFVLPVAADIIEQIKDFDNNLSEDLSGKYSDKFKALVDAYKDDAEALLMMIKEIIRYCKEDDLKDLWIEKDYDRLVNPNDVLEEDFEGEPLKGPEEGPQAGLSSLLNNAIQDEFSTIQLYNDIAVTARAEGFEDIATVIDSINTDENTHVGQLQELLKTVSPNAAAIDEAEKENISINEAGIESNTPQEWAEHYYDINKLDDFVANSLSDKSLSEDDLISIAEKSSTIEIDDMKRAIRNFNK